MHDMAGFLGFLFIWLFEDAGLTGGTGCPWSCRDAGKHDHIPFSRSRNADDMNRIVEYATRDQAQSAVNSLSNQNLMGRLVYVREVRPYRHSFWQLDTNNTLSQDREAEPRFTAPGGGRGGFEGGMGRGGGGGGGFGGGGYGAAQGGGGGGGGRQIYVSNVCTLPLLVSCLPTTQGRVNKNVLASLHRGLARLEGSFPPSW